MLENIKISSRTPAMHRCIAVAALLALMISAVSNVASAKAVYVINDGATSSIVESSCSAPASIVKQAGIEIAPTDRVESERNKDGTTEITILRSQDVSIQYMGSTLHTRAYRETVSELLDRMHIELGSEDVVSVNLGKYTEDGMVIDVKHYTYGTAEAVEPITYTTERVASSKLTRGKEVVKQAGKNGSAKVTYSVRYENGKEISREPISSEVVSAPQKAIVEYGTKSANIAKSDRIAKDQRNKNGSGVLTFQSGDTLTYSRVLTTNTTAYTSRPGARTASGKVAYVGGVAVDPRVIPLGSKLYITTTDGRIVYGMATAVDTGGAIKGNKLDLYYSSRSECVRFGRRNCTVYVLN